jgi:hypothetical protein
MPAKLYLYETILERLAQDLEDMAAELGQFIQEAHAIVGQRHVARHRPVPAADQPHIRNSMVGRTVAFDSTPLGTGGGVWQKKDRGEGVV